MKYKIDRFAFEVTRRCNHNCAHCMRGKKENLDMPKEIIDYVFKNNNVSFHTIVFTGGEPTLNPDLIIYAIDKIIENNIIVDEIQMITNGLIFNEDLVKAFNRFAEYKRNIFEKVLDNSSADEDIKNIFRDHYNRCNDAARIIFSNTKYHPKLNPEIRKKYKDAANGTWIENYDLSNWEVIKTGNSTFGYKLGHGVRPILLDYDKENETVSLISERPFRFIKEPDFKVSDEVKANGIFSCLYVTVNGDYTTQGFGTFTDIDKKILGSIYDFNLDELVERGYAYHVESLSRLAIEEAERTIKERTIKPSMVPLERRNKLIEKYKNECQKVYDEDKIQKIVDGIIDRDSFEGENIHDYIADISVLPKEFHDFIVYEVPKGFNDIIYIKTEPVTYKLRRRIYYPAYEPVKERKQKVLKCRPVYNREDYK